MSKNTPDYYRIPEGAEDVWDAIPPETPHQIAVAIKYLFRAGRKPQAPTWVDLIKARNAIDHWLKQNNVSAAFPPVPTPAAEPAKPEPPKTEPEQDPSSLLFGRLSLAIRGVWIWEIREHDEWYEGVFSRDGRCGAEGPRATVRALSLECLILNAFDEVRK